MSRLTASVNYSDDEVALAMCLKANFLLAQLILGALELDLVHCTQTSRVAVTKKFTGMWFLRIFAGTLHLVNRKKMFTHLVYHVDYVVRILQVRKPRSSAALMFAAPAASFFGGLVSPEGGGNDNPSESSHEQLAGSFPLLAVNLRNNSAIRTAIPVWTIKQLDDKDNHAFKSKSSF